LRTDDARPGFGGFRFATFPEYAHLFTSAIDWRVDDGGGRNVLAVEIAADYPSRALDCAEVTARELVAAHGMDLGEVGALVAGASTPGFARALAERLGISRTATTPDELSRAHTADLAAALESVALAGAGTVLLVSVGAGITVAAALYQA
jgi:hypothetical protein